MATKEFQQSKEVVAERNREDIVKVMKDISDEDKKKKSPRTDHSLISEAVDQIGLAISAGKIIMEKDNGDPLNKKEILEKIEWVFRWDKGIEFEKDVKKFMNAVGFEKDTVIGTVSRKNEIRVELEKGGHRQIDVMGMFEKKLFVVDAKFTRDVNGVYGGNKKLLATAIKDHHERISRLREEIDAVREDKPYLVDRRFKWNEVNLKLYADVPKDELKYVGVIALRNVLTDKNTGAGRALKKHKFAKWDKSFLRYYQSLASNINNYAMYDMLGDMDEVGTRVMFEPDTEKAHLKNDDDEPVRAFCLKSTYVRQSQDKTQQLMSNAQKQALKKLQSKLSKTGKLTKNQRAKYNDLRKLASKEMSIYQFLMEPEKLLKIATVARRERPNEHFYQRQLDASHLLDLAEFYKEGGIAPNNIVIGMSDKTDKKLVFSQLKPTYTGKATRAYKMWRELQKESDPLEFGTVTFPRKYRSCWVIDGQHRLYSVVKTRNVNIGGKKVKQKILQRNMRLPIIAFSPIDQSTMGSMFLTINDEQKRIKPDLKHELYASYKKDSPKEDEKLKGRQAAIAIQLNKTENSKLFGWIYYPSQGMDPDTPKPVPKSHQVSISAMYDSINTSRLAREVLVPGQQPTKSKSKSKKNKTTPTVEEIRNPLFPKKSLTVEGKILAFGSKLFFDFVDDRVVKLISDWYNALAEEYPDIYKQGHNGVFLQKQMSKIWLPLLQQIVAELAPTIPTKTDLKNYAVALGPIKTTNTGGNEIFNPLSYLADIASNPKKQSEVFTNASKWGPAERELKNIVKKIRNNGYSDFAEKTGLLIHMPEEWLKLERRCGQWIEQNVKNWKHILGCHKPSSAELCRYCSEDGKSDPSSRYATLAAKDPSHPKRNLYTHELIEMKDVEKIINMEDDQGDYHTRKLLVSELIGKDSFDGMREQKVEEFLMEKLADFADEFQAKRERDESFSDTLHRANKPNIESLTKGLDGILGTDSLAEEQG